MSSHRKKNNFGGNLNNQSGQQNLNFFSKNVIFSQNIKKKTRNLQKKLVAIFTILIVF